MQESLDHKEYNDERNSRKAASPGRVYHASSCSGLHGSAAGQWRTFVKWLRHVLRARGLVDLDPKQAFPIVT